MIARTVLGKILVFDIFFVGIGTGAILDNVYRTRVSSAASNDSKSAETHLTPQDRAKRDRERMAQYLGLNQNQQEQIQKILDEAGGQFRSLRAQTDPEFKALHEKTDPQFKAIEEGVRTKIRAVLQPEQQKKMDEFWAKRGSGGRGRPGQRPGDRLEKSDGSDKSDKQ